MNIREYIGIDYKKKYTINEFNNILLKYNNLDIKNYYMDGYCIKFLCKLHDLDKHNIDPIINFINMFKDINEIEKKNINPNRYSVAGNIILTLSYINARDETYVYKIMDFLLGKNTNMAKLSVSCRNNVKKTHGIDAYCFSNLNNLDIAKYVVDNYNIIQNVRKLINNYDILLFDITNDLQFIKQILLISNCKQKNLPKCVIIYEILYYYLLDKN